MELFVYGIINDPFVFEVRDEAVNAVFNFINEFVLVFRFPNLLEFAAVI